MGDRDQDLWIGTNQGLCVMNRKTGVFRRIDLGQSPTGIAASNILCLFQDLQGLIWVGTDQGLIKCNSQGERIRWYTPDSNAPVPFGWGDCAATQWIFDEFKLEPTIGGEDDPRLKACVHYNYPGCTLYGQLFTDVYATNLDAIWVKKYCNDESGRADEKDWRSGINERLLRYSDVLLMYAECQNELNDRDECAKYIQIVRDRANLPDREAEFAALTQAEMRD
jgi:hypothetical protein